MGKIEKLSEDVIDQTVNGASVSDIVQLITDFCQKEYEEKLRWIPVEEKLPEKQGHYLVVAPKSFPKNCKVVVAEFYEDNNTFYSESSDCPINDATHWRHIL